MGLIYCYTYTPTGKKYIGQTTNFNKRQKEHLHETRTNIEFHSLLQTEYNNFIIEILEDNIPVELLDEKEKYYIQLYNTFKGFGFNLTAGGDGGFTYCQRYWEEHPEEMAAHIAKVQPLAAEAAKQWRKEHPEEEKQRIENLHQKAAEWRKNNPEIFSANLANAQQKAKEWREANPEQFAESRKKAIEASSKKVRCVNTGEIFPSASEAARQYGLAASNISGCCRGARKSAGKTKNGEKIVWEYVK